MQQKQTVSSPQGKQRWPVPAAHLCADLCGCAALHGKHQLDFSMSGESHSALNPKVWGSGGQMSCSKEDEEDGPFSRYRQHFDIWFLLMRTRNLHSFSLLLGRQAGTRPGLHSIIIQCNPPHKVFWFHFTSVRSFPAISITMDSILPQPVLQLATPHALL